MSRPLKERLSAFLFYQETDAWLSLLRTGLGLQVVFYTFALRTDWNYLFAGTGRGLISRDLAEALLSIESRFVPRLGWLVGMGESFGLREETVLLVAWILLTLAGLALIAGVFSRAAAISAWFLHLSAAATGTFVSYGADNFITIGLFYLMLSPLPDRQSLDSRWRGKKSSPHFLGFWRRVLQLHVCIIYFFSGLTKCLGNGWWNGDNLWRSLIRPPFNLIAPETWAHGQYFFPVLGIAVWVIEIGYPVFIWINRTRKMWLIAAIVMHLAIGLAMGMYLFALIMIILNLAAFGPGFVFGRDDESETRSDYAAPTASEHLT